MTLNQSPDMPSSPSATEQTEYQYEAWKTKNQSESRSSLFLALAKAQGEFPEIPKDRTVTVQPLRGNAYQFRYASLGAIIKAVKKALSDNNISYTQTLSFDTNDRLYYLETTLWHGEACVSSSTPLIFGDGAGNQQLGSALTYMRRYALAAILGVVADEDDDGNAADGNEVKSIQESTKKNAPKPPADDPISTGIVGKLGVRSEGIPLPVQGDAAVLNDIGLNFVPAKIDVAMLPDESAADWMAWGQAFMAQARAAPTLADLDELEKLNNTPLVNMKLYAVKLFNNLTIAMVKVRKELEKKDAK